MQAKLCHVRYVGDNERYPEAVINLCLTPAIRMRTGVGRID